MTESVQYLHTFYSKGGIRLTVTEREEIEQDGKDWRLDYDRSVQTISCQFEARSNYRYFSDAFIGLRPVRCIENNQTKWRSLNISDG